MWFKLTFLIFTLQFGSCSLFATRPKLEMRLAQTAFLAAQEAQAFDYHPEIYRKAEVYFLKAKSAYQKKDFDKALRFALLSKKYSEQAELLTIKSTITEGVR